MMEYIRNLLTGQRERTEDGASAVEYGLLIAGIAAVVLVAVFALGPVVKNQFSNTCKSINGNTDCPTSVPTTGG
jgi:pilus assembly protein Flp/PilA